MRARRRLICPFRQGELDGLCGVYAVINAIRFALRFDAKLNDEDWSRLFAELLLAVDDTVGAATVITSGITDRPLRSLLKTAAAHMADSHDLTVSVSRPAKAQTLGDILTCAEDHLSQPRSAVLVELGGQLDHWSVVASIGRRFISLFDSSGYHRLLLDRCSSRSEQRGKPAGGQVLSIHALLSISTNTLD